MHHDIQLFAEYAVTPFVGVWIETDINCLVLAILSVTPFVGVWIETSTCSILKSTLESHPSWVCGLKLVILSFFLIELIVTPFVGVWIETSSILTMILHILSHPSWVCGLKLTNYAESKQNLESHPSWVCGLKLIKTSCFIDLRFVTPFVGVWIETATVMINKKLAKGHTLRGCVD